MNPSGTNVFQQFFQHPHYRSLKNHLYNYLLRKRAIRNGLASERPDRILEVGSGMSPIVNANRKTVYTDLSWLALRILKETEGKGGYVVADANALPFRTGAISHAVCSEVLEHLEDDRPALGELSRVLSPSGTLFVTFPHRRFYFTYDDHFVNHFRRYEQTDMDDKLREAGLEPRWTEKVLGPLDKFTMYFAAYIFSLTRNLRPSEPVRSPEGDVRPPGWLTRSAVFLFQWINIAVAGIAWLDARMIPRSLATVLLVKADKRRPKD